MMYDRAVGAIPRHLLRALMMPHKTKIALALGRCPDCCQELEAIDTRERACPTPGGGYTFNYYHWPWITAELPPDLNAS